MHVVGHDVLRRVLARPHRHRRGDHPRAPRRRRPTGGAAARPPAHAHDVAPPSRRCSPSGYTVVCPDLRGYGASCGPPTTPDHEPYSKRAMARDVVARHGGARPRALRRRRARPRQRRSPSASPSMPPMRVSRVAILDGMPFVEALERCDARFAQQLVALVVLRPDREAGRGVDLARSRRVVSRRPRAHGSGEPCGLAARDPRSGDGPRAWSRTTARASGSTASTRRPTARRAGGSRARCCSRARSTTTWRSSTATRSRSGATGRDDVRGARIDSGHHMAEEAPEQLAAVLLEFLDGR